MFIRRKPPSTGNFPSFTLKQTNFFFIEHLLRYTMIFNPDTLFVMLGLGSIKPLFQEFQFHCELISDSEITTKTRLVKGDRELFLRLCEDGRSVHLLEFGGKISCVKWLEASVGSDLAVLRKHLLYGRYSHELEDYHLKYDRPVTIIFAGYGMGKTACLHQIKQRLMIQNKNQFILYLNDVKLRHFLNSVSSSTAITFVEFFGVDLTNPNIHIMYDNFECLKDRDDIIDIMTDFHLSYRQIKQWITCSEIECQNKLESKLGTFACFLDSIEEESQFEYLKKIWGIRKYKFDNTVSDILDHCDKWYWKDNCKNVLPYTNLFCNYPLHLKMIALRFRPIYNLEQIRNVTILDVYETFVKSVYRSENIEELAVQKLFERINVEFKFKTKIKLMRETFDFENVINYLAAKWFSKNFHNYQVELKLLLEIGSCSLSFQYFFNSFLCRGMPLHTAVLNRWAIDPLLNQSTINERDAGGRTGLHLVNNPHMLRTLISAGAQMEVKDDVLQWTPLQYCDYNGLLKCLENLLASGAGADKLTWSLNLSESEISNRFEFACGQIVKLPNYVKFICQNVPEFQVSPKSIGNVFFKMPSAVTMAVLRRAKKPLNYYYNCSGKTALFYAVEDNNLDAVKILINDLGFDVNHKSYKQRAPFHVACENEFLDIADVLLQAGADINITHGRYNYNAFSDCCINDNVQVMKYLLDRGINVNINIDSGEKPLELACRNDSIHVFEYLFKNDANLIFNYEIHYVDLLYYALHEPSIRIVEFLLKQEKIININKKFYKFGKTLLHMACLYTWYDGDSVVPMLISLGADVNATDNEGCTPIYDLCYGGNVEVIRVLVENGCNLSHFNNDGETPLHYFTMKCFQIRPGLHYGYAKLILRIEQLLTYGADVNARTRTTGDTPLHIASRNGNFAVICCLVLHGADIHVVNNKGETPLHLACLMESTHRNKNLIPCKYLVSKGADVNKRTHSGKTPIMYAVSCPSNIDELLNLGADIFCKDNNNKTLVHYFTEYGLLDKLKILSNIGLNDAKSLDSSDQTVFHFAI